VATNIGRVRLSADQRREQFVTIAIEHFGHGGYHGTSTEAIAAESGVSQPYLFRLFKTKRELFLACVERCQHRILEAFETAGREAPEGEALHAMGRAYMDLLEDPAYLRFQLQTYAACADPEIRAPVREGFRGLAALVREVTGAPEADIWSFVATGMMLNVLASIGLREIADEDPWAAAWSDPKALFDQ
jgi:AcrR family transcriptional regulator